MAAKPGRRRWMTSTGGPGNDAYYNAVACDAAGNIYAAGAYCDSTAWGRTIGSSGAAQTAGPLGPLWMIMFLLRTRGPHSRMRLLRMPLAMSMWPAYRRRLRLDRPQRDRRQQLCHRGHLAFLPRGRNFDLCSSNGRDFRRRSGQLSPVNGHGVSAWIVRRSQDGGATWSTMDTFYGSVSTGKGTTYYIGAAHAIRADAAGNIYAAGQLGIPNKSSTSWEWVVRKSSNGGNSWSTVDTFQLSTGFDTWAYCVCCGFERQPFCRRKRLRIGLDCARESGRHRFLANG